MAEIRKTEETTIDGLVGENEMKKCRLLLVDDETEFVKILVKRLKRQGSEASGDHDGEGLLPAVVMDPITAANGLEAIKIVEEQHVDVVILDVKMPGLGGVEVLRKIKLKHPLVEVIMLTGHASVESAVEGLALGAFDYVTKPCDFFDLMKKVNEAYATRQAAEERIRKAKTEQIISHPLAVFDEQEE